jgi:hypothetical protein
LRDYAPPPVPDDKNLAKIPLLNAPADSEAQTKFWFEFGTRLSPQRKNSAHRGTLRGLFRDRLPSFFENKPADLGAIRAEISEQEKAHNLESMDTYLARIGPVFAEIGSAAEKRPYLRYDYTWEKPWEITLPQISAIRDLAEAAAMNSLVHLEHDRPDDAARLLCLSLRLRSAIRSEPMIIAQLTSTIVGAHAINVVWQGQLRHQWTPRELDTFSALLADDHILGGYRRSFSAEAAFGVAWSLDFVNRADVANLTGISPPAARALRWTPSGWLYQNAAVVGRFALDHAVPSVDSDTGRVHEANYPASLEDSRSGPRPYNVIARLVTPSYGGVAKVAGHTKTTHDLARLAVALEKHLFAHGSYPDSLAPLLAADPALAALHDPFDGKPYRYRRETDGGFTLWGIGQNLRDDGATYPDRQGPRADYATGDLVWRVPAR